MAEQFHARGYGIIIEIKCGVMQGRKMFMGALLTQRKKAGGSHFAVMGKIFAAHDWIVKRLNFVVAQRDFGHAFKARECFWTIVCGGSAWKKMHGGACAKRRGNAFTNFYDTRVHMIAHGIF